MPRTKSHVVETNSINFIRNKVDSFYSNGDALFREWNEKDYGIDLVIEFFDNGYPTGNIAYLQIKATESKIRKNITSDDVSCPNVSSSSLEYATQNKIPFILIYISMIDPIEFYFIDVQSLNVRKLIKKAKENETSRTTVKIPLTNYSKGDMTSLFRLIKQYF